MPATQTAVPPTTPAAATALTSFSAPVGGDPRVIAGITTLTQKLLNAAAVALKLVTGGAIGDGTGGTVLIRNTVLLGKDVQVDGALTLNGGQTSMSGPNRIGAEVVIDGTIATGTIAPAGVSAPSGISNGRFFYIVANITAGAALTEQTIDDSNCIDGDEFEVWLKAGITGICVIKAPGGAALVAFRTDVSTAMPGCRFRRAGGSWRVIRGGTNG